MATASNFMIGTYKPKQPNTMAATFAAANPPEPTWQEKLINYSKDHNSGRAEYQRALQVYNAKSALGDTEGAGAAQKWMGQVNTATGGTAVPNPNDDVRQSLKAYLERNNRPVTPFVYDPNKDAAFQAQKANIEQDTQRGMNNARVESGAVGMRGGSLQNNQLAQVFAQNQERLQNQVLPNFMAQAYQRYRDQQAQEERQAQGLLTYAGALGDLNQQEFTNNRTTTQDAFNNDLALRQEGRQNKLDNQAVAQWYEQQYGVPIEAKEDWGLVSDQVKGLTPLAMQQFQQQKSLQEAGLTGMYNGAPTMERESMAFNQGAENRRIGLSASSQTQSASNARINQLMDVWKATGKAPAGLESLGVQPGAEFNDGKNKNQVDMQKEIQGLTGSLRSGELTPSAALQQLEEDFSFGFYTKPQYDQLKSTITQLAPTYTREPVLTKEQQDQMPSEAQLEKLIPAGVPELDWKSWYKDPKGRVAGLPFEQWRQLYGPRLGPRK